jgi:hypothetical protein
MAKKIERKSRSAHGGRRKNAGRKPGTRNKITVLIKASLAETAKAYTADAIATLVEIMSNPAHPASARATCANSILDRAHGKPVQQLEHTGKDGKAIETKDVSEMSLNEIGRSIAFALAAGVPREG